eukprot:2241059-Pleurochrysis_carterae.AAC.1
MFRSKAFEGWDAGAGGAHPTVQTLCEGEPAMRRPVPERNRGSACSSQPAAALGWVAQLRRLRAWHRPEG